MATVTNQNIPLVHRKEWQMMTPAPVASAAGSFVVCDVYERDNLALFVQTASVHYLYHHDEDAWVQIPSLSLAGTFGAGATGARRRWSSTITATGGSTTTATTTAAINGLCIGKTVRFLTGSQAGQFTTITGAIIIPGGTSTIQFAALPGAIANTDTFVVETGRFYIVSAGTLAAGAFKSYCPLTGTVEAALSITSLPATLGTACRLVATPSGEIADAFATGTATSATSTTLVNSAKTWTVNQWTNYQVRITSGTGIGQIRTISSNTGTTLTVPAWTVTPDATSVYAIEGNDDYLYLIGNAAITMYRYSISANTWTVMAPTTARAAAPGAGMSANWVAKTGDTNWADESNIKDGRYIYSFRGAAGALLDRFDIAGGTAGAGAWAAITYTNQAEVFGAGSAHAANGRYIYIRKDATHRYFKYSIRGNYMEALSTNLFPDSTAVEGDKLWFKVYQESGVDKLSWIYSLRNSATEVHRMLLI